jgi:hypothetical protein
LLIGLAIPECPSDFAEAIVGLVGIEEQGIWLDRLMSRDWRAVDLDAGTRAETFSPIHSMHLPGLPAIGDDLVLPDHRRLIHLPARMGKHPAS